MNTQIKPNTVWIDADACPVAIKEIVYRAAERTGLDLYLVANQYLQVPKRSNVFMLQVPRGFDEADNEIVKRCAEGDLVVTADIPLAAEVLEKGGEAISPRGERFRRDTIAGKLSMRSFMADLRDSGVQTGGPAPLSQADRHAFATQLEAWLKQQGDG